MVITKQLPEHLVLVPQRFWSRMQCPMELPSLADTRPLECTTLSVLRRPATGERGEGLHIVITVIVTRLRKRNSRALELAGPDHRDPLGSSTCHLR